MAMTYDNNVPTNSHVRMHNGEVSDEYENLETIDLVSVVSYDTSRSIIESDDQRQQGIQHFVHALRFFQSHREDKETSKDNTQQPTKLRLFSKRQRKFQNVFLRREPMTNIKGEKEGWNDPASHALDPKLRRHQCAQRTNSK
jgi:hypothetical protein